MYRVELRVINYLNSHLPIRGSLSLCYLRLLVKVFPEIALISPFLILPRMVWNMVVKLIDMLIRRLFGVHNGLNLYNYNFLYSYYCIISSIQEERHKL